MRIAWVALVVAGVASRTAPTVASRSHSNRAAHDSCTTPQYRQFDFFAGDWDAYEVSAPDTVVARNRVDIILGGCVLREVYSQNDGLRGESFSMYDATQRRWHQTWVNDRGGLLLLDGGLKAGRMVLTGVERDRNGTASLLRGTWYSEGPSVRETAERSVDGGKTWKPVFDIMFKTHHGP
jgi:hypothetical protein